MNNCIDKENNQQTETRNEVCKVIETNFEKSKQTKQNKQDMTVPFARAQLT